jgi:hypothetical protein
VIAVAPSGLDYLGRLTQGAQSLALGLTLTAAAQLVEVWLPMSSSIQKIFLVLVSVTLIGLVLAAIVFVKAFSGWQMAIRAGNETATVQHLKTISVVESDYFYSHRKSFGTFEQLVKEQMLSAKFDGNPVTVDGYILTLTLTAEPPSFAVTANPASAAEGSKHFYLDSVSREIRVNSDKPAGPNDPVLNK